MINNVGLGFASSNIIDHEHNISNVGLYLARGEKLKFFCSRLPDITKDYLRLPGLPEITKITMRLPKITKITKDYQGLPGITRDYQGLPRITRGLPGITMGLPWDYHGITAGLPRDYHEITRDYQGNLEITNVTSN